METLIVFVFGAVVGLFGVRVFDAIKLDLENDGIAAETAVSSEVTAVETSVASKL